MKILERGVFYLNRLSITSVFFCLTENSVFLIFCRDHDAFPSFFCLQDMK